MAGFKLFNFSQQLTELSMRARGARHEILSANVANAETPGYRPRDLDFESVIRAAAQLDDDSAGTREQKMERLLAAPLELEGSVYEPVVPDPKHGEERLDGNSVGLDRQLALLNENALSYEASLTLFSRTMANLRYAIGEGRR
jgi:flagellar basal-body rod protein FlgB